jgi:class 3 adenylate cyclase
MDYTAVGQTTHLAARLEQMAKPGSVLTTGETLRLAAEFVQVKAPPVPSPAALFAAPRPFSQPPNRWSRYSRRGGKRRLKLLSPK